MNLLILSLTEWWPLSHGFELMGSGEACGLLAVGLLCFSIFLHCSVALQLLSSLTFNINLNPHLLVCAFMDERFSGASSRAKLLFDRVGAFPWPSLALLCFCYFALLPLYYCI